MVAHKTRDVVKLVNILQNYGIILYTEFHQRSYCWAQLVKTVKMSFTNLIAMNQSQNVGLLIL